MSLSNKSGRGAGLKTPRVLAPVVNGVRDDDSETGTLER